MTTPVDDILDWFEAAFTVRLAYTPGAGNRPGDLVALWECKVCAALIRGAGRAAHRFWHLSSREVDQ